MTTIEPSPFWHQVVACLVQFHDRKPEVAYALVAKYRRTLASLEMRPITTEFDSMRCDGIRADMVEHDEPFNVACQLAENSLNLDEYWERYEQLMSLVQRATGAAVA